MLSLIIAEAALEIVPQNIQNHSSVRMHAARLGRKASEILLDRSYHHAAMHNLENSHKRGRPDLLHIALLEVTSSPLYRKGLVDLYVHTITDKVITIKNARLPRSYPRFEGLMIDIFKKKEIVSDNMIIKLEEMNFGTLARKLGRNVIGLSRLGIRSNAENIAKISVEKNGVIIVGGFPRGSFSNNVSKYFDCIYSISKYALDAHIVIGRIIYECEKLLRILY